MNKYTVLKQTIAAVLFSGLSCSMEPPCQFEREEQKLMERIYFISGLEGRHKKYEGTQCEDLIHIHDQIRSNPELPIETISMGAIKSGGIIKK